MSTTSDSTAPKRHRREEPFPASESAEVAERRKEKKEKKRKPEAKTKAKRAEKDEKQRRSEAPDAGANLERPKAAKKRKEKAEETAPLPTDEHLAAPPKRASEKKKEEKATERDASSPPSGEAESAYRDVGAVSVRSEVPDEDDDSAPIAPTSDDARGSGDEEPSVPPPRPRSRKRSVSSSGPAATATATATHGAPRHDASRSSSAVSRANRNRLDEICKVAYERAKSLVPSVKMSNKAALTLASLVDDLMQRLVDRSLEAFGAQGKKTMTAQDVFVAMRTLMPRSLHELALRRGCEEIAARRGHSEAYRELVEQLDREGDPADEPDAGRQQEGRGGHAASEGEPPRAARPTKKARTEVREKAAT